ncbi:MAG: hypothetical protein K6G26_04010 [Lachnospiraceae bacterium]|nr:hypothetical protein [Lachnospiraceae bacterium]
MKKYLALALMIIIMMIPSKAYADPVGSSRIILDSYKIVSGSLSSGSVVEIEFSLRNVSTDRDANSVLITFTSSDNILSPAEGSSNQLYIDQIKAGETVTSNVKWRVSSNRNFNGECQITVRTNHLEGTGANATAMNNEFYIGISQQDTDNIEVNNASIVDKVVANKPALINIEYSNISQSDMKNVKLHMEGDIKDGETEVDLGTLAAGDKKYRDVSVTFTEAGEKTVNIYFTYEGTAGVAHTSQSTELTTSVLASTNSTKTNDINSGEKEEKSKVSSSDLAMMGIIAVLLVVFLTKYISKKKK